MKIEWNETNIEPVEFKCLVKLEEVEEKTSGGIFLPGERKDRDQQAKVFAQLLAVGGMAFTDGAGNKWDGAVPKPGDKVIITKYGGAGVMSPDDPYRLINDKDIVAIDRRAP